MTRLGRANGTLFALLAAAALATGACGGPIFANAPAATSAPHEKATPEPAVVDPQPITFPPDDAPHDRLTEWWYVTGHLTAANGEHFGYEFVIFRALRGSFPVTWASHVALTRETAGTFAYAQRSEVGPQVDMRDRLSRGASAAFVLSGATPWTMLVANDGSMTLSGTAGDAEIALQLSAGSAPVLHDTDGWVGFANAGGSYYYSRTHMPTGGTLTLNGAALAVTGSSWFDHQWGDFIAIGGGGWDWFAVSLADGNDLMLSFVRDAAGGYPLVYGTWVDRRGHVRRVDGSQITLTKLGSWVSPHTGTTWPAGWRVQIATLGLDATVLPTVADQELDTRASTGVIYWEGSCTVSATLDGRAVAGRAYVELTGYASLR